MIKFICLILILFTGFVHAENHPFEPTFCGANTLEKQSPAPKIKSVCYGQVTHEDMLFRAIQIEFNSNPTELWVEYSWNEVSSHQKELELMLFNSKEVQKTKALISLDKDGVVIRAEGTSLDKTSYDVLKTTDRTASQKPSPRINVKDEGNPSLEAVVLLHGNGMSLESFTQISKALSHQYRVISYDQRGHGFTHYDGLDFSISSMVNDLKIVLDSLNIQRAHLVGHSFGARIALAFAAKYPERILSVVNEDMELRQREAATDEICENYSLQVKQQIADYAPYAWGCFANAADLNSTLLDYTGPVLVMRAHTQLSAISALGLEEMRTLRSSLKVVDFPQASHTIHQSQPEGYITTLKNFFSTISK